MNTTQFLTMLISICTPFFGSWMEQRKQTKGMERLGVEMRNAIKAMAKGEQKHTNEVQEIKSTLATVLVRVDSIERRMESK